MKQRLELVPYQEAPSPPMTPALHAACARAIHVVTADGEVLRGGRAVLCILEALAPPRARWAARLLSKPPFIWIIELGYRLVANHRSFFSRLFFRKE